VNVCGSCGLDFGSLRAFDAHRVGKLAHDHSPEHLDGRRCRSVEELQAVGFTPDARGRWGQVARRFDAARRFSTDPDKRQAAL
jgi:hypothetical protein